VIHPRARCLDPPRPEQRLEPQHHPRGILHQILIVAGEVLEHGAPGIAVVDRAQRSPSQQLRQLVRVQLVVPVPLPTFSPPIADHHPIDPRHQQPVQPLRLGPFLEGDMNRAAHPPEELHDRPLLRRQQRPRYYSSTRLAHRGGRGCLMNIERDILGSAFHESRSLLWSIVVWRLHGNSKGRALNMR
jgi:hypothetical protein